MRNHNYNLLFCPTFRFKATILMSLPNLPRSQCVDSSISSLNSSLQIVFVCLFVCFFFLVFWFWVFFMS
jgi:hypothetical protein